MENNNTNESNTSDRQVDVDAYIEQWSQFCDALKQHGREVLSHASDLDEVTQADGLRYLSRLVRGGLEKFVEYDDPNDPILYKVFHEKLKWAGDNPDSIYSISSLSANNDYLVRGNRGSVHYVNFTAMSMGTDGSVGVGGFLDSTELKIDAEGNFRLWISQQPPADAAINWLPMSGDTNSVMIRQTFLNRRTENELTARIQLQSQLVRSKALSRSQILNGINKASSFFQKTSATFVGLSASMHEGVNQLPEANPDSVKALGGDPNYRYFWSSFQLQRGQALLVHLPEVPECDTWSLCLHNYWLESLDYHKSTIILNKHTAQPNSDGSVTMVVSLDKPDSANWLDACDHPLGQMVFRWTKPSKVIAPQTELVELDAVDWQQKNQRWQPSQSS